MNSWCLIPSLEERFAPKTKPTNQAQTSNLFTLTYDLVENSRYRFAMVLPASTLLPVHQSAQVPCIRRKMLIRPQPLHILIPQTNRNGNLAVRRPRH